VFVVVTDDVVTVVDVATVKDIEVCVEAGIDVVV